MAISKHAGFHPHQQSPPIAIRGMEEDHDRRRRQIIECHQQMEFWAKKLKVLLDEQEKYFKLAKLRLDAPANWYRLSSTEKVDKEFILEALKSKRLPTALKRFNEDDFPLQIRSDRDIFVARLGRESFAKEFLDSDMIVPPPLCDDKEIMLEVMRRQPRAVEFLPEVWRDDKDFFDAVWSQDDSPKDFLKHFSETLRSDVELMRKVLGDAKTEMSMMKFCSKSLRDDKDFFIQVVGQNIMESKQKNASHDFHKTKNHVLQYASTRLRNDSDVVLTCIEQWPMNLQYASDDIQRNKDIVLKAALNDGDALLLYKSDIIKDGLLDDKEVAESVLSSGNTPFAIIRSCLQLHGHDKAIIRLALSNPEMKWSMVPDHFLSEPEFMVRRFQEICDCNVVWGMMPDEMKSNSIVALFIATNMQSVDGRLLPQILDACPALLSDRDAIQKIMSCHWHDFDLISHLIESSTIDIRGDKDIMMSLIERCPMFVQICSDEIRGDRDVVLAVADSCQGDLGLVPQEYQVEHPEVVIRAIEKFSSNLISLELGICRDVWQDRNIAMTWVANGGPWQWDFPERYSEDEELVLTAIKNRWHSFHHVSESLRTNKAFVMKALAVDARVTIHYLDKDTLHDHEVALEAISRDERAIEAYEDTQGILFLSTFVEKTKQKLREHRIFQDEVVASMKNSPTSALSMLNQGSIMLTMYEQKIASYVGVLEGQELARYQAACSNLASWGL